MTPAPTTVPDQGRDAAVRALATVLGMHGDERVQESYLHAATNALHNLDANPEAKAALARWLVGPEFEVIDNPNPEPGFERMIVRRLAAPALPAKAGLDVVVVHRITCKALIDHEPGSDQPYRWPCYDFAAEYARLQGAITEEESSKP